MITFLYCEITNGGMEHFKFYGSEQLESLPGWMRGDCIPHDQELVDWLCCAEVGEMFEHRMGVVVRLRDGE